LKLLGLAVLLLQSAVTIPSAPVPSGVATPTVPIVKKARPEAKLYDPSADARVQTNVALTRAAINNKQVIIVMGANWCHDSISLAGWFETPRFKDMLGPLYEIVYVDVGEPQTGHGRNLDIAKRFGAKSIKGTPTVLILSSEGKLLNKKDAPSWRNAASRSEDVIYTYFADFR
jgi:thiol-disulfide isomerase/thioredoxin